MSNLGYETIKQLDSLHPDLYFMGIYSISNEVGITHSAIDECQLKQKMLSVSFQTAALVTKEKMGSVSNYVVCKTSDITYTELQTQMNDTKRSLHLSRETIMKNVLIVGAGRLGKGFIGETFDNAGWNITF